MKLPASSPVPGPTVGVFDSGLGGLSVLAELIRLIPNADWVYVADSAHAPYGERSDEYVHARSAGLTQTLIEEFACQCVVIACNTATAVSANKLRHRWPDTPIVGVEPGIKPAAQLSRNRRVGVMATDATLRSERFRRLVDCHAAGVQVIEQACTGLAAAIEEGQLGSPRITHLLDDYCGRLVAQEVDTVVLGCTHYSFVKPHIRDRLPNHAQVVDTATAVAQQTRRVLQDTGANLAPQSTTKPARIRLLSSADPGHLVRIAHQWLTVSEQTELIGLKLPSV
jgi:glutamate racemase